MKEQFIRFANKIQELSSVTVEEIREFQTCFKVKTIKKGDYFLRENSTCKEIAFINRGAFRVYRNKNGEEINTCFCMENEVMSSFESFVNQTPSLENIQAMEEGEIITLSLDDFKTLVKANNEWINMRIELTNQECIRLANRANTLSFESALEKYQNLMEKEPLIVQRVSNYNIASYLGIKRETLSRIRAQIK